METTELHGLLAVFSGTGCCCSRLLAEAGARVIELERPEGDFAKEYSNVVECHSSYFVWHNRGKESIAVDLREDEDKQLLTSMLKRAEIFLQILQKVR